MALMPLTSSDQNILIELAKKSIQHGLDEGVHLEYPIDAQEYSEQLQVNRGSFVTLKLNDDLRGCIGSIEAYQPLVLDVCHNAKSAAFNDPRFGPLQENEFNQLDIHISVLSEAEPMTFTSEQDLLAQLQPGIDGLILEDQHHRGTFLPSVWESLPDPQQFFNHLKQKANLPTSHWSDTLQILRYTTESFGDE
jgi:AmmeMemoRadiSam system protein A